ncbi:Serine/threonine-protein kinase PrkC [Clostridium felsineum DSM 794]|nr:Serine/threonine-protein kinase PrkC [Clostridium felsineum DSM 794]
MIGTVLSNRYKIEEEIGIGGTAVVYKAMDTLLNRHVAVKVLKREFTEDEEFVFKFKREASAAARIANANIVNIYDVGADGNTNYIVMEYVAGKTLKKVIKESGKIDFEKIIDYSTQIAKALNFAHKNGIVHRDIKPHNIMVTEDGIIKVTDFGIAKASNETTITTTNKVVGSAHYLSPEQAQGIPVDCRSDIYSFGIVLYEMATGKVPYDADTPISIALKHIQDDAVPPNELNKDVPPALNKMILKCIEKKPENRYQNATEILDELSRVRNNFVDDEEFTRVMDPMQLQNEKNNANKDLDNDDTYYDGEPYNADNEEEEEEAVKKGPKKSIALNGKVKKILVVSIVLVIIVAGSALAFSMGSGIFNSSSNAQTKVKVPKIRGLKESDAKKKVEDAKLKFQVVDKVKSSQPKGTVVTCYPDEDTEVSTGSVVRVDISAGETEQKTPSFVGLTESAAKEQIKQYGCNVGSVTTEHSSDVAEGNVIRQSPSEGSDLTKGMTIDLVVSSGPEVKKATVPSVYGKSSDTASSILQNAGFGVNVATEAVKDASQDGIVIKEYPNGYVNAGATITIVIGKYTQPQQQPQQQPQPQPQQNNNNNNTNNTNNANTNNTNTNNTNNNTPDSNNNGGKAPTQ